MKAVPVLVAMAFALASGSSPSQQRPAQDKPAQDKAVRAKAAREKAAREKAAQEKAAQEKAAREKAAPPAGRLSPAEFAEARLAYCKGHEALGAMAFLRHRQGRDVDALPLVIQRDFRDMRAADLRMRIWTLNFGMNVATTELEAKRGAFKHCVDGFGPIMEQMRFGPLR